MKNGSCFLRAIETDLKRWASGDDKGLTRVLEMGYQDRFLPMAIKMLATERHRNLIPPEDLVHRAYYKLIALKKRRFDHSTAFLALFQKTMARVLIDLARGEAAAMRGGNEKQKNQISIQDCAEWLHE